MAMDFDLSDLSEKNLVESIENEFLNLLARDPEHVILIDSTEQLELLKQNGRVLKEDLNELKVLELAGDGWKGTFEQYKIKKNGRFIGGFNTPSAKNIDKLFAELIGLDNLSKCWSWHRITPAIARSRLTKLIKLRGDIAHRVRSKGTIQKSVVERHLELIQRLANHSNNRVDRYLKQLAKRQYGQK